jgi:hypothetical protein
MTPSDRVRDAWKSHARDEFLRAQFPGPTRSMYDFQGRRRMEGVIRQALKVLADESRWVAP